MSEHIGSLAGPEYVAKVNRVLHEARELREALRVVPIGAISTPVLTRGLFAPLQGLALAIDSLDNYISAAWAYQQPGEP